MSKLLHVDSSVLGANSASRQLTAEIVAQWRAAHPDTTVEYLDLAADAPSHFGPDALGIKVGQPAEPTEAQRRENAVSERLVSQFLAADVVVIGAPLYNFSIPTQLKAWLDRLAVAGKSFRYTEAGPEGLLGGKRVIVALASGGQYADDSPFEHSKSYLTAFFNFLGIQPEFVDASGIAMGAEEALASADRQIEALAA